MSLDQVWWCTHVISLGKLRQENYEFQADWANSETIFFSLSLSKKKKKKKKRRILYK
jgi:hypothetical protein